MIPLLLGLALKSAIIAAVGLALSELFASRPEAERATLLRITTGLLLALPLIALASPDIRLRLLPAPAAEPAPLIWAETWARCAGR